MKKWWIVFLSIGLILGVALPASAVDVKFSGSYYAQGWYEDRPTLKKDVGPSTAAYHQRLRVMTEFRISPGLWANMRFDALERVWGDHPGTVGATGMWGSGEQNIMVDVAFVTFNSAVGQWKVGYQTVNDFYWGTVIGNSLIEYPAIAWSYKIGNFTPFALVEKWGENSYGPKSGASGASNTGEPNYADLDYDRYYAGVMYKKAPIDAGIRYRYVRSAYLRNVAWTPDNRAKYGNLTNTVLSHHTMTPYVKADIGPVKIQWEGSWITGKAASESSAVHPDIDVEALGMGLFADYYAGPFQVGATFVWFQGDDPSTTTKCEGYDMLGGTSFSPTLMMWNFDHWKFITGNRTGFVTGTDLLGTSNALGNQVKNTRLISARVGFKPVPKLELLAWVTYAMADQKPAGFVSDSYGTEIDVTATYKIFPNLSYMVGYGYWVVGDYFKGTKAANEISNNWTLTHKLELIF